jgi:hypothetical protein
LRTFWYTIVENSLFSLLLTSMYSSLHQCEAGFEILKPFRNSLQILESLSKSKQMNRVLKYLGGAVVASRRAPRRGGRRRPRWGWETVDVNAGTGSGVQWWASALEGVAACVRRRSCCMRRRPRGVRRFGGLRQPAEGGDLRLMAACGVRWWAETSCGGGNLRLMAAYGVRRRPAADGGGLVRLMRDVNWGRVVPFFFPNWCVRRWCPFLGVLAVLTVIIWVIRC